jgi:anti-anti-sigma regulatory factor
MRSHAGNLWQMDTTAAGTTRRSPLGEHRCWVYDDRQAFRDQAVEFLLAGLRAGQRVQYLGSGAATELTGELAAFHDLDDLLRTGRLTVSSLDDLYGVDEVVDPQVPVAGYRVATQAALADGFSGLRVVADATALVRTPAQRQAFARYEHLIDRYMAQHPFAAMCAYDVRVLGQEAAAEIACLHPTANPGASAFRWYSPHAAAMRLVGEIDVGNQGIFDTALARTMPLLAGAAVEVDSSDLSFIDHRGLLALEAQAQRCGSQLTLVGASPVLEQIGDMLGLQAVAVKAAN